MTINQASGQADPTNAGPVYFTVRFRDPVSVFQTGDVTVSGTAGATAAVVSGAGQDYDVAVYGMTTDGTVIATIGAGKAHDAAGNGNTASTSTDKTVTYDTSTTVAITSWTNPVNNAKQTNVTVSGTAEAGDTVELKITDMGAAHTVGSFTTTATGGTWSFSSIDVSSLNDGAITYSVKATDAATNTATDSKTATKTTLKANDDPVIANANTADNAFDVFSNDNPTNPQFSSVQTTGTGLPGTNTAPTAQGGTATYCATCGPTGGQAIKYTPAVDFTGSDSFRYTITDGAGHFSSATVTITVTATGSLDSQMILEDSGFNDQHGSFNVLFGKSPKPNETLAMRLKNTEPGSLHMTARIFNHTNVNTGDCTVLHMATAAPSTPPTATVSWPC